MNFKLIFFNFLYPNILSCKIVSYEHNKSKNLK